MRKTAILLLTAVAIMSCRQTEAPPSETGATIGTAVSTESATTSPTTAPCPSPPPDPARKITITVPCDGATVAPREFVGGMVADQNARVSVVIRPMRANGYWVQPNVTVRQGGNWRVLCYFGEPGSQHSGMPYEVMAFVNPAENLKEGQQLPDWPQAESKSNVIQVVRE